MTASPNCLVQSGGGGFVATTNGVNVTAGSTISIQLASTANVSFWYLQVIGTDDLTTNPVLANVNPTTNEVATPSSTVTFTYPNAAGRAVLLRSTVKEGSLTYTSTFAIYSLIGTTFRTGAGGERRETNSTFGWAATLNPVIRRVAQELPLATALDTGKALLVTGDGTAAWQNVNSLIPMVRVFPGVAGRQQLQGVAAQTHTSIGCIQYDPSASFGSGGGVTRTVKFQAILQASAGVTVSIQMTNLNNGGSVIGGTTLVSTVAANSGPETLISGTLPIGGLGNIQNTNQTYDVVMWVSTPSGTPANDAATCKSAEIVVTWA